MSGVAGRSPPIVICAASHRTRLAEDQASRTTYVSPWMAIIERELEFAPAQNMKSTLRSASRDYIAIVAALPDTAFPSSGNTVQRWRALPRNCLLGSSTRVRRCSRELMEETGFTARAIACGRVLRTLHCTNVGSRRPPRSSWSLPHCSSCQRAAGRIARVRHGTQPRRVIGICSRQALAQSRTGRRL